MLVHRRPGEAASLEALNYIYIELKTSYELTVL